MNKFSKIGSSFLITTLCLLIPACDIELNKQTQKNTDPNQEKEAKETISSVSIFENYQIEINGTRYKAQYTMTTGSKTQYYLARMGCVDKLELWRLGVLDQAEENYAVNRLLLREAAAELGIAPSNEEIDEYIKTRIPAFQINNQFSYDAYKELIGYNNGELNRSAENDVRELVSDMIIHDTIKQMKADEAINQKISGCKAVLQLANQEEPAAPSAEVLKQYWEQHQLNYMTEEKRAFTVIKLMGDRKVVGAASIIQEALVKAPASAPEEVITAKLSECAELEDYEIQPYNECTATTAPDELKQQSVPINGVDIPLNELIFNSALTSQTAGQYSTYFTDEGDLNAYIIRIDSITPPAPQSFEQAEAAVRQDWIADARVKLFYAKANAIQSMINEALAAGIDMKNAFVAATEAGAVVTEFTNEPLYTVAATGAQTASQLSRTHSGSLAPLVKTPTEVVITGISNRTKTKAEENSAMDQVTNTILTEALMQEWIIAAYIRYKVMVPQTED